MENLKKVGDNIFVGTLVKNNQTFRISIPSTISLNREISRIYKETKKLNKRKRILVDVDFRIRPLDE